MKWSFKEASNGDESYHNEPPPKRRRVMELQKKTTLQQIINEVTKRNEYFKEIELCLKASLTDKVIMEVIKYCRPISFAFSPTIAFEVDGEVYTNGYEIDYDTREDKISEMCCTITNQSVSDYTIISVGVCDRLVDIIRNHKGDEFKNCSLIEFGPKRIIIDENDKDIQLLMKQMSVQYNIQSNLYNCVVFRNPLALEELMTLAYYAGFDHSMLTDIEYIECMGKRFVVLTYDTEFIKID